MHNDNRLRNLQDLDVVSLQEPRYSFTSPTFKVSELFALMRQNYTRNGNWFLEGVDCEVLTPKGDWQQGKVRFCLEFVPEQSVTESEEKTPNVDVILDKTNGSPLDEIRLTIDERL